MHFKSLLGLEMTRFPLDNPAMVGFASSQPDDVEVQVCCSFLVAVVLPQTFPGQRQQGHVPQCGIGGAIVMLGSLWGDTWSKKISIIFIH